VVSLESQRGGLHRLSVTHQLMYSFGGMSAYIRLPNNPYTIPPPHMLHIFWIIDTNMGQKSTL